ncbi:cytochrome b561 [Marinicauda pacifica]|uniref:Cytochrome B n=1 Tax=Marinicauda pacifica TaxID=1133559 RepID=A0A4S2HDT9_9PROT|nr:cytochrome b/b6 domain-containing protein [Marinicauda pacifica]TGY94156.1 cytochrome B [Marinicauda pacifica]GGE33380.1 cytochrome b561 [Marinicauda pacifica]
MSSQTHTPRTVRVWDPVVRLGHWIIVAAFFTAYLSGDEWAGIHIWAGYTVAAAVLVRLIWGLVGTRHARFSSFVRGPRAVMAYLKGLFSKKAERHLGHNPAGALMIVALLVSLAGTTVSGMALLAAEDGRGPLAGVIASGDGVPVERSTDVDVRRDGQEEGTEGHEEGGTGEIIEEVHSIFTYLTLALVALHVLGVAASSLAHRENLVRAMVTGRKRPLE